jgi:hypothetical protein
MRSTYLHADLVTCQSPKHEGHPCGDVVECLRTPEGCTFIVSDGIGSGVRANLYAQFVLSRVLQRVRLGHSLRQAFSDAVKTLEENRGKEMPWAAFAAVRIMPDGNATVLSYEMPAAILIARRHAHLLPHQRVTSGRAIVTQSRCCLVPGDSLLVMSDGITQAGIGRRLADGWTAEGVVRELNLQLSRGVGVSELPALLHRKARELDGAAAGDDATVVMAACRAGTIASILTGPPADQGLDGEVVRTFVEDDAIHIVCGGTTAGIVGREMGVPVKVVPPPRAGYTPPRYEIQGIDLATEGAICLNQLYNVLELPSARFEEQNAVTELHDILHRADRIRITAGTAANVGGDSIMFRQQGILTRSRIIPLLAERLRAAGKLVEVNWV